MHRNIFTKSFIFVSRYQQVRHWFSHSTVSEFAVRSISCNVTSDLYNSMPKNWNRYTKPLDNSPRRYYHSPSNHWNSESKMTTPNQKSDKDETVQVQASTPKQNHKLPTNEVAMMNDAREIFQHAVNSVLPKEMVAKHLQMDAPGDSMTIENNTYHLNKNVYVVGFGKAVLGMARAVDDLIGRHIVRGVVSVPQGTQEDFRKAGKVEMLLNSSSSIVVREGAAHNMPDQPAYEAACEIASLVQFVGKGDLLVVLISGGGSALLPAPAPPLTLIDMLSVTGKMSRGGATINQLNTVRKQLDSLKGGGLTKLASPARVVSLILSDIVGDPLDLIASGPTVADPSRPEDCLAIFSHLNISNTVPKPVTKFLEEKAEKLKTLEKDGGSHCDDVMSDEGSKVKGHVNQQPDTGSSRSGGASIVSSECLEMKHVQNTIIGSNKIACEKACEVGNNLGYSPFILSTQLEGEAKEVGRMFAHLALFITAHLVRRENGNMDYNLNGVDLDFDEVRKRLISEFHLTNNRLDEIVNHVVDKSKMASSWSTQGVCIVAGGETTVTVTGTGRGGRNQEMSAYAGVELDKLFKEFPLLFSQSNTSAIETGKIVGEKEKPNKDGSKSDNISSNVAPKSPKLHTPNIVFLSAGTDGQDGPTPAAGGVVGLHFVTSVEQGSASLKMSLDQYLENNDSYALFERWGQGVGLVNTGLTGTNVMDVQVLLIQMNAN